MATPTFQFASGDSVIPAWASQLFTDTNLVDNRPLPHPGGISVNKATYFTLPEGVKVTSDGRYQVESTQLIQEIVRYLPAIRQCVGQPLIGKTVAFTGTLSMPRVQMHALVQNLGAYVTGTVNSSVDYLVVGQVKGVSTSKLSKATSSSSTFTLYEHEFVEMVLNSALGLKDNEY